MRFSLGMRSPWAGFLYLCCFLGLWIGSAAAQEPEPSPTPTGPIQMSVSSPFAFSQKPLLLLARTGKWFPIGVTLSNTGEAVSGDVRLRLLSNGGFERAPNDFYTPVDLPSNSRKVVWLYGRMERSLISGFEVTFSGRGFSALAARGDIQEPNEDQRVVLTVADTDDGLANTLKGLRSQGLYRSDSAGGGPRFNPNAQPVRPIQFGRELVPDRWFGFEAADLVVLGDFPHAALTPSQIEAIRGFVQGGGNLVVVGGGNAARLSTSPLKNLWPVRPTVSGVASTAEVQGLVKRYVATPKNGADRLGGAPVQVVRGTLDTAAVLQDGTATAPLFSMRDEGAGRCLFLSYNPAEPPFQGWSGQGDLWKNVFDLCSSPRRMESVDADFLNDAQGVTPSYNSQYTGSYNNGYNSYSPYDPNGGTTTTMGQLLQAIQRAPQLRMPPVSRIAWFLALYVFFLVPVNYAVLRFIDRRELAWVTIPVIVLVFSFWAYSAALSIRGKAILTRQVDVVQTSMGSWQGRDDSLLWLFSPRRSTYDFVSAGQGAAVSDFANKLGTEQGSFSILEPGDGASFKAERALVWMWTFRSFSAQSLVPLGKGVQFVGNTLVNNTPYDLKGVTWVQDQMVWPLGELKSKGKIAVTGAGEKLSADLAGGIGRASQLSKIFDSFTNSNNIPTAALAATLGTNLGKLNGESMLIAWGTEPVAAIDVNGARSSNLTLFIFRAPKVPVALAPQQALVSRTAFEPLNSGAAQTPVRYGTPGAGGYAIYNCVLPANGDLTLIARGFGLYKPSKNKRTASYYGRTPGTIQFEVKDAQSNEWRALNGKLTSDNATQGKWGFEAKINPAWARQPDSVLQLRARLSNQGIQIPSLNIYTAKGLSSAKVSKASRLEDFGAAPPPP